jgi:type II secretory pathway component PulL
MGTIVSSLSAEALARLAAAISVGLILTTTAFFLGQALRLNLQARSLETKIAALRQPNADKALDLKSQITKLDQLARELDRPDALLALQAAQMIIKPFGYKLSQFSVNQDTVSFELPREASAGVDLLVDEFEASPYFSKVEPVIDRTRNKLVLTMSITANPSLGSTKMTDKLTPLG